MTDEDSSTPHEPSAGTARFVVQLIEGRTFDDPDVIKAIATSQMAVRERLFGARIAIIEGPEKGAAELAEQPLFRTVRPERTHRVR